MPPLAALLKALRERAGLSQVEVSLRAGLSETYYGKIEEGKRRPSAPVLLRILATLAGTAAEEEQAIRLFAEARWPTALLERLTPGPLPGTAAAAVAPAPKGPRRPRRLAVVLLASGALAASPPAVVVARPITAETRDSVAFRRWTALPAA
jgi:transcriptional regulator with XRE-family HTH domain